MLHSDHTSCIVCDMGTRIDGKLLVGAMPLASPVAVRKTGAMTRPPRGSVREEQKRLTRSRVLDAAVEVCAEKAFVDVTMEDFAKAAGVTRVTVYAHFPGKSDIVQALAERIYETMDEVYGQLAAIPDWTRATVRAWLDNAVSRWRKIAPVLRVVRVAGGMAGAGDFERSRARYVDKHGRYVAALIGDGARWRGVPPAEAHQRAVMAVLQSESFLTAWIAADLPMATADPLDLLTDSLCALLSPTSH
jgi:AcrR family transcriptional regulator